MEMVNVIQTKKIKLAIQIIWYLNFLDLRQDMLTLQMLKLLNIIWKNEGLDLKLLVYNCYSMGYKVGVYDFIESLKKLNIKSIFLLQRSVLLKS